MKASRAEATRAHAATQMASDLAACKATLQEIIALLRALQDECAELKDMVTRKDAERPKEKHAQ